MGKKLKIAIIVPDNRDEFRSYGDPAPHFGTAPTALLDGFSQLANDCEIHVVCCVQRPLEVPEKIGPNIFYHTEVVRKWGWLRGGYFGCIRSLRRQLRKIQPDIVHGQGTERYCALGAVFSGFPNVVTIHGNMRAIAEFFHARPGSFHWLTARLETLALHRTSGVFCNSTYTELQVSPRTRRIWRVANALRPDFFSPVPDSKTKAQPVILNVGSAMPYKRQLELLGVAHRLHQRGIKLEWQFAGKLDGPTAYQAALARALAIGEQAGYARCLGSLSTSQLIAAMNAASALVHFPSEEAFGLVVAEALSRNLKFFGAATGGVVDIATGVDGAELIPAQDFTRLEAAIADWQQAGSPQPQKAAQTIRERYHPLIIAREHLRIYREVLGG
ncbi:MAG TPA: glycosyltransferase [Verrucomicrobiae bacterium]